MGNRRLAAAAAMALASLACLVGGSPPANGTPASVAVHVHFAEVPERACRSRYASTGAGRPSDNFPRWRRIAIPYDLADKVAVYSDPRQTLSVLGPQGWNCLATIGNGHVDITVFAPGQRVPPESGLQPSSHRRSRLVALNLVGDNAGSVSDYLLACPYFRASRVSLYQGNPWARPAMCRIPYGERVSGIRVGLKSVDDPPYVAGNNQPSGGSNWALGNVHWANDSVGGYLMTCTLPASAHQICYASLAWFAQHWTTS